LSAEADCLKARAAVAGWSGRREVEMNFDPDQHPAVMGFFSLVVVCLLTWLSFKMRQSAAARSGLPPPPFFDFKLARRGLIAVLMTALAVAPLVWLESAQDQFPELFAYSSVGILIAMLIYLLVFESSRRRRLPRITDFPPGTQFVIKDFDIPLAQVPDRDTDRCIWINWYGGRPRRYHVRFLKIDNNWPADSFEEWVRVVEESIDSVKLRWPYP
jgi:hypothetical protein